MRLLVDTHVWIWGFGELNRISKEARRVTSDPDNELFLSPASIWETLMLGRKRRLELAPSSTEWVLNALRRSALTAVPLTNTIALRTAELDAFGSEDPADRFIVATAIEHDLTLVTADRAMRAFDPVRTIW